MMTRSFWLILSQHSPLFLVQLILVSKLVSTSGSSHNNVFVSWKIIYIFQRLHFYFSPYIIIKYSKIWVFVLMKLEFLASTRVYKTWRFGILFHFFWDRTWVSRMLWWTPREIICKFAYDRSRFFYWWNTWPSYILFCGTHKKVY